MLSLVNFNKKMWKKSRVMAHSLLPGSFYSESTSAKKYGILIFACAWHWLLSVGDISISARRHNPPLLPIIITTKLPAGEALMWRTSPCSMKARGYERCDRAPRSFTHRRALQWLRRPLGSFSESRKKSRGGWIAAVWGERRATFQPVIMQDYCDGVHVWSEWCEVTL